MQVNTTSQVNSAKAAGTSATSGSVDKTVDYNAFLKLLVAQMKNQDPTNPTDSTQYMSQLASFSAVGQQVQTNAKLDSLLSGSRLSQASQVIGHVLTSADGSVSGKVVSITLQSTGSVATLENGKTVAITDGVQIR